MCLLERQGKTHSQVNLKAARVTDLKFIDQTINRHDGPIYIYKNATVVLLRTELLLLPIVRTAKCDDKQEVGWTDDDDDDVLTRWRSEHPANSCWGSAAVHSADSGPASSSARQRASPWPTAPGAGCWSPPPPAHRTHRLEIISSRSSRGGAS